MVILISSQQANIEYSPVNDGYNVILAPVVTNIIYIGAMPAGGEAEDGYLSSGTLNTNLAGVAQLPITTYYFVAAVDTGFGRRCWVSLSPAAASAIPLAPTPIGSYDATTFVILSSWTVVSENA